MKTIERCKTMKQEILNYMYKLIEIIKEQDIQIIHEFSSKIDEDLKKNEETYKKQRKKAEELVAKIK